MKVRMLVSVAGANFAPQVGEIVDVIETKAARWVAIGYAEYVEDIQPPSIETDQPKQKRRGATKPASSETGE